MNATEIRFNELLAHVTEKLNESAKPLSLSEIILVNEDRDTGQVALRVVPEEDALEWLVGVDPSAKALGQVGDLISSRAPEQRIVVAVLRTGAICADYLDVEGSEQA